MDKKEFERKVQEFKLGLEIDRNALDDAVEQHSVLYMAVQEEFIFAKSRADELKTAMDEEYARAAFRVREGMEKSREKWTEAQVKEGIAVDEKYLESIADYQTARLQADLFGGLVSAYDQRGKMLRELSSLYQAGYFALQSTRVIENKMKDVDASRARDVLRNARNSRSTLPSRRVGR